MSYLLDTNILIYVVQGREEVCLALERLDQERFFISCMSRLEFMVGSDGMNEDYLKYYLNECGNIPIDTQITDLVASLHQKHPALKFKDAVIVATALTHNKTLVSADKIFSRIEGLDFILIKPNQGN